MVQAADVAVAQVAAADAVQVEADVPAEGTKPALPSNRSRF